MASATKSYEDGNLQDMIVEKNSLQLPGDVNSDYMVDMSDLEEVADNYGSIDIAGEKALTDTNNDGKVDLYDLGTTGINYGIKIFSTNDAKGGSTSIYVDPASSREEPDDELNVYVKIDTSENVFAASLVVEYDETLLNATQVTEGGFLSGGGKSTYTVIYIDRDNGTIYFDSTRYDTQTGISGTGDLLQITFRMLQEGTSNVDITDFEVVDENLSVVTTVATSNGTVWVETNDPAYIDAISDQNVDEGQILSFTVTANDPEGDDFNLSLISGLGTLIGDAYSYTPGWDANHDDEVYGVTIESEDEYGATDTEDFQVTVTDVNRDPTINGITDKSVDEGQTLTFTVSGSDPESDTLTYSVTSGPGSIVGTTYSYSPSWDTNHDNEIYSVTVEVSDGHGGSDDTSFQLTVTDVNRDPTVTSISDKNVDEGQTLTVTLSGSDPESDTLTYSVQSGPGSVVGTTYSYTPGWDTNHDNEIDTVTIEATDGHGGSDTEDFQVTVTDVNRAPTIDSFTPVDTTPDVDEGSILSFSVTASDPESDTLAYSWKLDGDEKSTSSTYVYSPGYSDSGPHAVDVTVSDGYGGMDTQSWDVTVNDVPIACYENSDCGTDGYIGDPFCDGNAVLRTYRTHTCNDPGQPSSYCSYSDDNITQDTCGYKCVSGSCVSNQPPSIDSYLPLTDPNIDEGQNQAFSISASDPYGDSLTTVWTLDGIVVDNDDSYTYTSDYDSAGTYTVIANVSDGELYTTHSWTLTVNDVPIACYDNSDCGTDGYVGDPFCSGLDVKGTYRTYTCSDPGTPSSSCSYSDEDMIQETCSYLCESGACVANDDPVITEIPDKNVSEGQTLSFTITATDTHGDTVELAVISGPGSIVGTTYSYSPGWDTNHDNEIDTVTIEATDGHGGSDTEDFQLTVTDVNRAPEISGYVPADTTPDVDEGSMIFFNVTVSDPEFDTLTYSWKLDGDEKSTSSTYVYSPGYSDSGPHSVNVTVSDGYGGTDTQSWDVIINDVDTVDVQLYDGVNNNVELPSTPASTAIDDVLSTISGKYCIVQVYESGSWKEYIPGNRPSACSAYVNPPPWHENTLAILDGSLPFNIRMIGDAVLTVDIV